MSQKGKSSRPRRSSTTRTTSTTFGHDYACIPLSVAIVGLIVALVVVIVLAALAATAYRLYRRKRAHYYALLELYRYVNERLTQMRGGETTADEATETTAHPLPPGAERQMKAVVYSNLVRQQYEYERQLGTELNWASRPESPVWNERQPMRHSPVRFARDSRTLSVDNSGFNSCNDPLSLDSQQSQEEPYPHLSDVRLNRVSAADAEAQSMRTRSVSHDPTYVDVDVELECMQIANAMSAQENISPSWPIS